MTEFQTVSESELQSIEGGFSAFVVGMIIGGAFVAGVAVGIQLASKGQAPCPAK